jgi:hypothetical protein
VESENPFVTAEDEEDLNIKDPWQIPNPVQKTEIESVSPDFESRHHKVKSKVVESPAPGFYNSTLSGIKKGLKQSTSNKNLH